jgi:hypothetical protein
MRKILLFLTVFLLVGVSINAQTDIAGKILRRFNRIGLGNSRKFQINYRTLPHRNFFARLLRRFDCKFIRRYFKLRGWLFYRAPICLLAFAFFVRAR